MIRNCAGNSWPSMAIVTLLLVAICAFMFHPHRQPPGTTACPSSAGPSTRRASASPWGRGTGRLPARALEQRPPSGPGGFPCPTSPWRWAGDGEAVVVDSKFYDLNDEDALRPWCGGTCRQRGETGLLRSYHLRYLRKATATGWRIAFTDISQEQSTTWNLPDQYAAHRPGAPWWGSFSSACCCPGGRSTYRWSGPGNSSASFSRRLLNELKTPLTVVLSNDMLREYGEEQNERERRWMDNVRASSPPDEKLVEEDAHLGPVGQPVPAGPGPERVNFSDLVTDCALMLSRWSLSPAGCWRRPWARNCTSPGTRES